MHFLSNVKCVFENAFDSETEKREIIFYGK
jgi:hypothetical protein